MSLDLTTLISDLTLAFETRVGDTFTDQSTAIGDTARDIANAIDRFVKTAQINYTTGLVAPGGSGGPVTGSFTGNLT